MTFFAKKAIEKCQISKSRGPPWSAAPPSDAHDGDLVLNEMQRRMRKRSQL